MSVARRHNSVRRGFTLVELLVVVGIIVLLASIAIPAMRPALEGSRIREASRSVNVYLGRARNVAIKTGRPVGVMFERFNQQEEASIVLRQVEVPPPYGGDVEGAVVRVLDCTFTDDDTWSSEPYYWSGGARVIKVRVLDGALSSGLVRRGDLMQLNHQGPWYTIDADASSAVPADFPSLKPDFPLNNGYINFFNPAGKMVSTDTWGTWITSHVLTLTLPRISGYRSPFPEARDSSAPGPQEGMPFEILRQPIPSVAAPLHLARGAVVDLAASGPDSLLPDSLVSENPGDQLPVVVMFSPNGAVDRVYFDHPTYGYGGHRLAEPVHFLIGRWERMRDAPAGSPGAEDGLLNWQDASNLWVTLNSQTGLVTVAELNADQLDATTNMYVPSSCDTARQFAREAQISKGGR